MFRFAAHNHSELSHPATVHGPEQHVRSADFYKSRFAPYRVPGVVLDSRGRVGHGPTVLQTKEETRVGRLDNKVFADRCPLPNMHKVSRDAVTEFGGIDIAIANAGVASSESPGS